MLTIALNTLHCMTYSSVNHGDGTADLQSTLTYRQGFALSYDQASFASRRGLFPLTGITFPLFSLVRRVLSLVHRRRAIAGTTWDDDQHVDMVEAAEALLEELKEEKKRMDRLTRGERLKVLKP